MHKENGPKSRAVRKRQEALVDLILGGKYNSQQAILDALKEKEKSLDEEFGISQSTLSRDLQVLKIDKSPEGFYVVSSNLEEERMGAALDGLLALANAKAHHPVDFTCITCDEGYEKLIAKGIRGKYKEKVLATICDSGTVVIMHSSSIQGLF
ncbi:Arginine repressor [Paenibacillus sophorae]|uniref:Arginine repressor n=1 Tax=Paenibacillus sophorae TaxID=1333845 RepID=A0A1H8TJP8_9BACL|nr:hypothetical protein [Paenibacillus sophorae]QWU16230.1 hypothetical protein KP014_02865 [Paenibacillus sophorae]SEO90718.1 Arginine repressor [Paenibacillus sophorae]